jgi:hypothetical protein
MIWPLIIGALGVVIVFAIAAVTIGREAHRLDSFAPMPVFDVEQAVAHIAGVLPDDMTASVSFWDVRRVLDWELEDLDQRGLARESLIVEGPRGPRIEEPEVLDDGLVARLTKRATDEGVDTLGADEVRAILDGKLSYLHRIGAVGPQARPETIP